MKTSMQLPWRSGSLPFAKTIVSLGALVVCATSAQAQVLLNSDFTSPTVPSTGYTYEQSGENPAVLANWTVAVGVPSDFANGGGVSALGSGFTSVPGGASQYAFLNLFEPQTGTLTSDLVETSSSNTNPFLISSGDTFNLSVDVGNRVDSPYAQGATYTLSLLANGAVVDTVTLSGSSITQGTFAPLSLSYTATSAYAGDNLAVQLGITSTATSGAGGLTQGNFANVQLSVDSPSQVPEPSAWAMIVCGMSLLVFFQRMRRNQNS